MIGKHEFSYAGPLAWNILSIQPSTHCPSSIILSSIVSKPSFS